MLEAVPSRTAYRVALRRAAHQVFDDPVVFSDPFAMRILGLSEQDVRSGELRAPKRASSQSLRAFLVARSIFAEQVLAEAVARGVSQYVLLGAGLDTFAWRNPHDGLRVFEVDHPATQAWKQQLAEQNRMPQPASLVRVPVDFERDRLDERLTAAGFDGTRPALFAWLGVVPYLTDEAFSATLNFIAQQPPGSGVVLDYGIPREDLSTLERMAFESMAARVAAAGEPFRLFFSPAVMAQRLHEAGLTVTRDMDRVAINEQYFRGRCDGLKLLGTGGHFVSATRPGHVDSGSERGSN